MNYALVRPIWNVKEINLILACHLRKIYNKLGKMYFDNSRKVI